MQRKRKRMNKIKDRENKEMKWMSQSFSLENVLESKNKKDIIG